MTYVLEIPASPAQRRLWVIEQDMPGSTLHNLNMELVRVETLDPRSLRAALGDVIARHEALRTEFRLKDGVLHQAVRAPQPRIPLEYFDLTGQQAAAAGARYRLLRQELENTPFDLSAAPLLRMRQIRRRTPEPGGRAYDTMLLAMHHMVADGISAEVITSDLEHAYASRASGTPPSFEPLPIQYADYSAWLAERSQTPEAERDREYWRAHLADLEELDLTFGRPRQAAITDRGEAIPVDVDENQAAAVTRLASAHKATTFAVLLSAFSYALSRVFGAAEVAIGMATAGRPLPEVARTVGLFTERLVLRVDVSGRPTFRELVGRATDEVLTALEHDRAGFDEIVEAVAPARRYGVTPLAQASINLNTILSAGVVRRVGIDTVRHDIALNLVDNGRTIEGAVEFRSGLVDHATARRVADVFAAFLRAALRDPDAPADTVAVVDAGELRLLHHEQDGGPRPEGGPSLLGLVARWVTATPDALAVDGPDHRLTYRELWDHVADLAGRLARHGVVPGTETPVIVAVPRRAALPVCLLATFAAGGVYVPVDATAAPAFLAAAAETVGARLALVLPGTPPPPNVTALPVDVSHIPPAAEDVREDWHINPCCAAYVIFTAGTTGRPKGVTVEHRNLQAYLEGMLGLLKPSPGSVHLMVQAPTFDSSLTTLCGALASGGVVRLMSEDTAYDPALVQQSLTGAPADYLKITPSHLAALLTATEPAALRPRRALLLGGESARHELPGRLIGMGWKVVGHYGPTETTVGVLVHELRDGARRLVDTVPLGRPLPGVRVYVLDNAGNPVPPGCRGELYVAGALVARGYARSPGRTAEVFLPDPFTAEPGARMYRTGDLVRRLPDGTLEFCGRRDRQVKVRGHRIEPAALELVLSSVPGVSEVAVVARDDRLIAYVVTGSPGVSAAQIRAAAATRLPSFMVPDNVVRLGKLPLTASGKLDVAALPSPGGRLPGTGEAADAFLPPSTPMEKLLAELWCSVLRVPRVSVTDRFFEVGGDSIRAVYLVGAAASRGLRLAARDVFENQTIRTMAHRLESAAHDDPLPVRAVRAGLAGAIAPTVVRLPIAGEHAAGWPRAGPGLPPEVTSPRGVAVTWHSHLADVAADPLLCDDSSLCEFVAELAAATGHGQLSEGFAHGDPAGAALAADAGTIRLRLRDEVAAAFAASPRGAGEIHDAYGTQPVDIAAAAVLHALAADPDNPPSPAAGAMRHPAVLVADIAVAPAERHSGRQALPAVAQLPGPPAGGWQDPGTLLQATKAAMTRARDRCGTWTADALAGRTPIPAVALRILPLPASVRLHDPGAGGPADHSARGRTIIVFAGAELVMVPASAGAAAGARALAGRILAALGVLVTHCAASAPVYSPADFPEADLDDVTLARLLDRIGVQDTSERAVRKP